MTYVLGCVMIKGTAWPTTFDAMIDFRRDLRDKFGLHVRTEVKANWLLHGRGPLRRFDLTDVERAAIYRLHMRAAEWLETKTFAVVINKQTRPDAKPDHVRDLTWETLLQRLERFSSKKHEQVLVTHDHGEDHLIRKQARKARRAGTAGSAYGTGSLKRPFEQLLDDPVARDSSQSYFIQLADLAAYAAFRRLYPPPPHAHPVVKQNTWDKLKGARYRPVNRISGGPPGIVQRDA